MRLSNKQQIDLATIRHFIPSWVSYPEPTDEDIENFMGYSDQGKNKQMVNFRKIDGFNALIQGKRWRGIHIHEMYEPGILEGVMPYMTILEDMPKVVVNFLKKEMFEGIDAEMIGKAYKSFNK